LTDNDTDPDGDVLVIESVSALSQNGAAVSLVDGRVIYDPTGAFDAVAEGDVVTDSFEYTVSDQNGGTDTATVSMLITGTAGGVSPGPGDAVLTLSDDRFVTLDAGVNRVLAGEGSDVLVTAGGDDVLAGEAGSDLLIAGSGNDVLIGGAGGDNLRGGSGNDVFTIRAEDFPTDGTLTADFIEDFEPGADTVELSGFAGIGSGSDVTFDVFSGDLGIDLGENRFVVFRGIGSEGELQAGDIAVVAEGRDLAFDTAVTEQDLTPDDDRFVTTDAGANRVLAGSGNDVVVTSGGADELFGGTGSDLLIAGSGDDLLAGGADGDNLRGGAGADSFVFAADDFAGDAAVIADFVEDFAPGVDTVVLDGFAGLTSFADLDLGPAPTGDGVLLTLAENRFVVLEGVESAAALDAGDFLFEA